MSPRWSRGLILAWELAKLTACVGLLVFTIYATTGGL